ncbi:hypothetical protein Dda_6983 [Drechslerella dactyloides]|uniref:BZIP domain-containing protein n=1 Tax=Drechslerella dactyloides TaxID=74499 RepID=A0AAD6NH23_DREDA|nr:hypothetical protein Dda_6983 [Drechslerella dactyloides]
MSIPQPPEMRAEVSTGGLWPLESGSPGGSIPVSQFELETAIAIVPTPERSATATVPPPIPATFVVITRDELGKRHRNAMASVRCRERRKQSIQEDKERIKMLEKALVNKAAEISFLERKVSGLTMELDNMYDIMNSMRRKIRVYEGFPNLLPETNI